MRLLRFALAGGLLALALLAALSVRSSQPQFGDSLPGLSTAQRQLFETGQDAFSEVETVADGLGPVFNDVSCGSCHSAPIAGGGSARVVTRFGTSTNGVFDPLAQFGGSLIQDHGIGAVEGGCTYVPEQVPSIATIVAHRRTTPLFGLGLVEAVPDSTFQQIALLEALFTPSTKGRAHVVANLVTGGTSVGRFGWKAQVANLLQFSGDAYLNEMGITNPLFPDENCPNGDCGALACNPRPDLNDDGTDMQKFADFMRLLGAPPPGPTTGAVKAGQKLFANAGCASCHVASLQTGPNAVKALDRVTFSPYSDFLLHDMGPLGDGIAQGNATMTEIRTAPLWGVRAQPALLHDGRAATIQDAILGHDGQGKAARDKFAALSASDKAALVAFVGSL
jgi:CxxC motif-containing protein (DUF1111 family)